MEKKNILILTGSPRKNGNSDTLAQAFADKARANGHEVTLYRTADKQIRGCAACDRCWSKDGKPCVMQDDMQELFPMLNLADIVVFAAPIYFFGLPAQLKAVIDRFYPLCKDDKMDAFSGKQCFLIICGASDDENDFEPTIQTYEVMADYLGWEDCGTVVALGLEGTGDAKDSEWINAVRELAQSI